MTAQRRFLLFFLCVSFIFSYHRSQTHVRAAANDVSVQEILAQAMAEGAAEIDVSTYDMSIAAVGQIFADTLHEHPRLFHVGTELSYRYDERGRVLTVYPTYTLTGTALAEARRIYETTLADLCSVIDPAWSEADRALAVHDLLALRYAYDAEGERYDAYRLFRDGTGVCQAYAMAYMAVGRAVGLTVDLVYSDAMDHAWNHVLVDGAWYHMDVTRDDPIEGDSPVVRHTRLLRSDLGMAALGYVDYVCSGGHVCDSTRFETADGDSILAAWSAVPRRVGNAWCFIDDAHRVTPVALSPSAGVSDTGHTAAPDEAMIYPIGDVTRDGVVTPEDLLTLRRTEVVAAAGGDPFVAPCEAAVSARLREDILDARAAVVYPPARMADEAA